MSTLISISPIPLLDYSTPCTCDNCGFIAMRYLQNIDCIHCGCVLGHISTPRELYNAHPNAEYGGVNASKWGLAGQ